MMDCVAVQDRLDRAVREPLGAAERAAIEAHAATCRACADTLADIVALAPTVAALPRELPAPADSLTRIRARTSPRAPRVAVPVWALPAAAVLILGLGTALLVRVPKTDAPAPPLAPPPVLSAAPAPGALGLDGSYAAASAELIASYDSLKSRLAPRTRAALDRNLAVIDRALAETRAALADDPANVTLEQLFVAAQRQRLALLRQATALVYAS